MSDAFEPILEIGRVMRGFGRPWFVSGGWAIDLFLGEVTRKHEDLEVGIYRADQEAFREWLAGWEFERVDGERWEAWEAREVLELPDHQARVRDGVGAMEFEVFLNEATEGRWLSRRHAGLWRGLGEVWMVGEVGVPFISPEIQLLYKAKYQRAKDEHDFELAAPRLDEGRRRWLIEGLRLCHPGHDWLRKLE